LKCGLKYSATTPSRERLDLGCVGLDHVHGVAVATRFRDRALNHLVAGGAPGLTLMPYFFSNAADSGPDSGVCIEV
jgi:hypothetical protein